MCAVAESKAAHFAIAPGLRDDPFDSVVAVLPLVDVLAECALGLISAPESRRGESEIVTEGKGGGEMETSSGQF
jgi:hypothetical protein